MVYCGWLPDPAPAGIGARPMAPEGDPWSKIEIDGVSNSYIQMTCLNQGYSSSPLNQNFIETA